MFEEPVGLTYYQLLGVPPSATTQQIRRAYRSLSKRYHPDTAEVSEAIATARFHHLKEAYDTLMNPKQRATYDYLLGYTRAFGEERKGAIAPPPRREWTPEDLKFRQQCREDARKVVQDLRNLFIRLILLGVLIGGGFSWMFATVASRHLQAAPPTVRQP